MKELAVAWGSIFAALAVVNAWLALHPGNRYSRWGWWGCAVGCLGVVYESWRVLG